MLGKRYALLRKAVEDRADPRRDQTLYNLSQIIAYSPEPAERAEAEEIMEELRQSDSHYKDAWYFKRAMGARATLPTAKDCTRVIRTGLARRRRPAGTRGQFVLSPKIRFFFRNPQRGQIEVVTRFAETAPIMFANARDGHREAGHAIRWRWYELRVSPEAPTIHEEGRESDAKGPLPECNCLFRLGRVVGRHDALEGDAAIELKVASEMRDEERARGVLLRVEGVVSGSLNFSVLGSLGATMCRR